MTRGGAPPQLLKLCLDPSQVHQHLPIDHLCAVDLLMICLGDLIHVVYFVQDWIAYSFEVLGDLAHL